MTALTEKQIGAAVSRQFLNQKHLVVVPNCGWTAHECDLLCVTKKSQIIDFEIKRTRSDFLADAKKDKWKEWRSLAVRVDDASFETVPRLWPVNVWKHYYLMPDEIYKPDMLELMPSQKSGILTFSVVGGRIFIDCKKKAVHNPKYEPLDVSEIIDIARLPSLRYWNSLDGVA